LRAQHAVDRLGEPFEPPRVASIDQFDARPEKVWLDSHNPPADESTTSARAEDQHARAD
jgi:hypothetical protein